MVRVLCAPSHCTHKRCKRPSFVFLGGPWSKNNLAPPFPQLQMEDKKKKRSPKPCLAQPAQASGTLRRVPVPTSHSGSLALGLPHLPSPKQRAKFKR